MKAGCISSLRQKIFTHKSDELNRARNMLQSLQISPNEARNHGILVNQDGIMRSAMTLLSYPGIKFSSLRYLWPELSGFRGNIVEQLEIEALYSGYLERQKIDIESFKKDENQRIPEAIDYDDVASLSNEVRDKLKKMRPATIGAASRIPGMTPAAITNLMVHLTKMSNLAA